MASKLDASFPLLLLLAITLLIRPTHAFGAGNIGSISKIEGTNWRHGDIEDTLLTLLTARAMGGKKFSKMDVKRVYFGNWLRDYSQAIDVGTVKYVSAEAIRLLLWILGFMSFGYGTGEFEVTRDRLGTYRPEEHIDNPKDYADNLDARQYDRRLRGPVDERRELSIDERTGLKHYIATEEIGITTSAGMVRALFTKSIQLGRRYAQSHNEEDLYEALRLMGTASHCLEDYAAHSNYCELALIELGERNVFPHVGRRTQMQIHGARGPVFPVVTGTFGGVDFLHSVCGELSDKTTQSEIQDLEGTVNQSSHQDTSLLKELLSKLPSGILGDSDHAGKADELQANAQAAQMQNMHISPKQPEAFTRQVDGLARQIYPILEFHDNLMKHISEAIEKIPVLPELIEQLQEQVNVFVFSLLAPFVVPIINQVKEELSTGSSEIIQSSKDKQLIVFHDDSSTDPTHSMLSKDHFSNILNEPCGKIASATVAWVIPQIVACWDDSRIDINRTMNRIINGVFHHPALHQYGDDGARDGRMAMFGTVEKWWRQMNERERNELRSMLSREGVEQGRNHKEGVQDSGHGCGKPLGMPTMNTSTSSGALGGLGAGAVIGGLGVGAGLIGDMLGGGSGGNNHGSSQISNFAENAVGGGALGSIVGGLAGGVGGDLLGGAFEGGDSDRTGYAKKQHNPDGSDMTKVVEAGHRHGGRRQQERYGQAEMSHTQYQSGGYREEYSRYEQDGRTGQTGYGFEQTTEVQPMHGSGYAQRTERRYEHPGGTWDSEVQEQRLEYGQQYAREEIKHGHHKKDDSDDDSDSNDDDGYEKKQRKQRKKEQRRMEKMREEEEKQQRRRRSGSGSPKRRHSGGGSPKHQRKRESGGGGFGIGDVFGGGGGGGGGGRGGRGGRGGGHGNHGRGMSRDVGVDEFGGAGDWKQEIERPQYGESYGNEYGESAYGRDEQRFGGYEQRDNYGGGFSRRKEYGGGNVSRGDFGGGFDERSYDERPSYEGFNQPQQSFDNESYGEDRYGQQQQEYGGFDQTSYGGDTGYGQGDAGGYDQGGYGDNEYSRRGW